MTNGVSKRSISACKLQDCTRCLKGFCFRRHRFQKPMKEYFDYVLNGFLIFCRSGADHRGFIDSGHRRGRLAGLDTCWMNPGMIANDTGIVPTYQIQNLMSCIIF
ncbi:hypothetical protein PO124_30670 [Bacillus licheniformis]|nr:hypothetical protein [Bacillus licheniformis]